MCEKGKRVERVQREPTIDTTPHVVYLGGMEDTMRMWMLPPTQLCNRHLLGEHGELHKHRHNFVKRHRMGGRLAPVVQIVPHRMGERHDELAAEMLRRGMNHKSPYVQPDVSHLPIVEADVAHNRRDLAERCEDCAGLLQ